MQTFTFYNRDVGTPEGCSLTVGGVWTACNHVIMLSCYMSHVTMLPRCCVQCQQINTASCGLARATAAKWGTIVAGGVVQTSAYRQI